MHITLLGIGSLLMQDEGVGVHAVKYIQEHFETPGLEIVDGGTSGLDLLDYIENRDRATCGRCGKFRKRTRLYRRSAQ